MLKKLVCTCVLVIGLLGGTVGNALAQTSGPLGFAWDAPTSGGETVSYVVEVYKDGVLFTTETVATNYYEFTADALVPYYIKVAGVDALDQRGVFSENSDVEMLDFGPPSQPGKPYRVTP